jgi:CHAT domain-containing protein
MSFREAYYAVRGEFRKDPKWAHPFYWAAFTLYE